MKLDKRGLAFALGTIPVILIAVLIGDILARLLISPWNSHFEEMVNPAAAFLPFPALVYFIMRQKAQFGIKNVLVTLFLGTFLSAVFLHVFYQVFVPW